jgi:hypothetical protein
MTRGAPFAIILADLKELYSSSAESPIPGTRIVILLVRQKGTSVDVTLGLFLICRAGIVDDSDEPIAVSPDVEYHNIP